MNRNQRLVRMLAIVAAYYLVGILVFLNRPTPCPTWYEVMTMVVVVVGVLASMWSVVTL